MTSLTTQQVGAGNINRYWLAVRESFVKSKLDSWFASFRLGSYRRCTVENYKVVRKPARQAEVNGFDSRITSQYYVYE